MVLYFRSRSCGCRVTWSWWRHQIETFSALLALCAGNSPVTGESPSQRPVTRSIDVFFDLHLNKRLSKPSWGWWFETPSRSLWRHCKVLLSTDSQTRHQDSRTYMTRPINEAPQDIVCYFCRHLGLTKGQLPPGDSHLVLYRVRLYRCGWYWVHVHCVFCVWVLLFFYGDVIWTLRRLISPAILLFVQKLVQACSKQVTKVLYYLIFVMGIILCTKGQWRGNKSIVWHHHFVDKTLLSWIHLQGWF